MKRSFKVLSSGQFIQENMSAAHGQLSFRDLPVQVYPLSFSAPLLQVPVPFFRAEYNSLLIFSGGGGTQRLYNEVFEMSANDLLFIREGYLTAVQEVLPDTEGYFIHIDSAVLPQVVPNRTFLNELTFSPKRSLAKADMDWLCSCAELIGRSGPGLKNFTEISTAMLRAMFLKLSEAQQTDGRTKADRPTEVSLLFKELLYEHFKEKRDVRFYAQALSVTENYLNRCVKAVTNKAPKQHLNEVVIYYSQILLRSRPGDVAEIAFELNFNDPSYFGRLFRQVTGMTPTEYRSAVSQDSSGQARGFS